MSEMYDPAFPTNEEEARKNRELAKQKSESGNELEMKTLSCSSAPLLYDEIYSELVKKPHLTPESTMFSPKRELKKETPSNGLSSSCNRGKPKVAHGKNLPIYEDEDFNKPIKESANSANKLKWENLGVTPLQKTDLYKDILDGSIPEVKNQSAPSEFQQSSSPSEPAKTVKRESVPKRDIELKPVLSTTWGNIGGACFENGLYDDIIDVKSNLPVPQCSNSDLKTVVCEEYNASPNQKTTKHLKELVPSSTICNSGKLAETEKKSISPNRNLSLNVDVKEISSQETQTTLPSSSADNLQTNVQSDLYQDNVEHAIGVECNLSDRSINKREMCVQLESMSLAPNPNEILVPSDVPQYSTSKSQAIIYSSSTSTSENIINNETNAEAREVERLKRNGTVKLKPGSSITNSPLAHDIGNDLLGISEKDTLLQSSIDEPIEPRTKNASFVSSNSVSSVLETQQCSSEAVEPQSELNYKPSYEVEAYGGMNVDYQSNKNEPECLLGKTDAEQNEELQLEDKPDLMAPANLTKNTIDNNQKPQKKYLPTEIIAVIQDCSMDFVYPKYIPVSECNYKLPTSTVLNDQSGNPTMSVIHDNLLQDSNSPPKLAKQVTCSSEIDQTSESFQQNIHSFESSSPPKLTCLKPDHDSNKVHLVNFSGQFAKKNEQFQTYELGTAASKSSSLSSHEYEVENKSVFEHSSEGIYNNVDKTKDTSLECVSHHYALENEQFVKPQTENDSVSFTEVVLSDAQTNILDPGQSQNIQLVHLDLSQINVLHDDKDLAVLNTNSEISVNPTVLMANEDEALAQASEFKFEAVITDTASNLDEAHLIATQATEQLKNENLPSNGEKEADLAADYVEVHKEHRKDLDFVVETEVVPSEIVTEIVLSHSQDETATCKATEQKSCRPNLSLSELFYRRYIPGKRMLNNAVYDLRESSSYTSSVTSDADPNNINFVPLSCVNLDMANSSRELSTGTESDSSPIKAGSLNTGSSTGITEENLRDKISTEHANANLCVQYSSITQSFGDTVSESSLCLLKNVSDESQTSDSSSLISQKENTSSQLKSKFLTEADRDNIETSEAKECKMTNDQSVKKKYRKPAIASNVHGSSSEGSGSPATEEQTVRRSSRIRSLEEKREKQREFNRKKDLGSKHKKHFTMKKVSFTGAGVLGPDEMNGNTSQSIKDCPLNDGSESKKDDCDFNPKCEAGVSPFLDTSAFSPLLDPRRNLTDDDSKRPEKVKSRWRRNSELERGHSNSPLGLPLKVLNNSTNQVINAIPQLESPSSIEIHSNEPQNEKEKMPHFERIDENIYLFERKKSKSKKEVRRMACDCTLTKEEREEGYIGCLDDCLNRLLMIECGSRCALEDLCDNKRFMKKHYANSAAFRTDKKGWGLKAMEDMESGTFIMEYVGEVLSSQEFRQRVKQYAREKIDHYYFMALKGDEIIDATLKGNISRFINHSCDPNCETQKWTVNGELRIGFFTKRSVPLNEELTFNYQFQQYGREAQRCYCEATNCRGFIGGDKKMSLDKPGKVVVTPKKKRVTPIEEKKKEDVEDLALEEELEKLSSIGGLKNREQTLMLNRLMIRAEARDTRQRLLDIIQNTSEQACLRLFLDYHGLTLLWSWMVDLGDDASVLKKQILEILDILPISNKTMLLDSKILSVVQRWAIREEPVLPEKLELIEPEKITGCIEIESTDVTNSELLDSTIIDSESSSNLAKSHEDTEPEMVSNMLTSKEHDSEKPATLTEESNEETEKSLQAIKEESQEKAENSCEVHVMEANESERPSKKMKWDTDSNEETVVDQPQVASCLESFTQLPSIDDDIMDMEDVCLSDIVVRQVLRNLVNEVCYQSGDSRPSESNTCIKIENEGDEPMIQDLDDQPSENLEPKVIIDIPSLANKLLESWSSLKEVFRIPRLEHQKRMQDELEASSVLQSKDRERDRDSYDSPSRKRDYERDYGRSRDYDRRRDRSPRSRDDDDRRRSSYEEVHDSKPKKFMAPVSTGPKLSKEERRQLFELEVQQRDQEEALRRQQEYLASLQVMEIAAAPIIPQEFLIPTVFDTGEPIYESHPEYFGPHDYTQPMDYNVEFPGQIDYVDIEYIGPSEYTETADYVGPAPDYTLHSYMFDPVTCTYEFDLSSPFRTNTPPPGMEHLEPVPTLVQVYPGPSTSLQEEILVSILANENDDDFDDLEDECLPHTIQPIKTSLLRPTASSPAPKPISPYPSPSEDQSPSDLQSPSDISPQVPSPSEIPLPVDLPSPSQIPLPSSPVSPKSPEIASPKICSPVPISSSLPSLRLIVPEPVIHSLPFVSTKTEGSPTSSPVAESSFTPIVEEASPLPSPLLTSSPPIINSTPTTVPLLSASQHLPLPVVQIPSPSASTCNITLPSESTPTPESSPAQAEESIDISTMPSTLTTLVSYDPPSLIQSLLQRVVDVSSPASPISLPHAIVNALPALGSQAIACTSPVPGIVSPLGINQGNSVPASGSPFVASSFLPVNPQGGPVYYVQPSGAVVTIPDQSLAGVPGGVPIVHVAMAPQVVEEPGSPEPPAKPKRLKLPPSWKTAKDGEGNVYYYHSVTRQTQWDPPPGTVEEDEPPMEADSPEYEEIATKHSRRRTTTAPADTSSEAAKRLKEMFRSKMSSYIVQCLNPYRKPECKLGRITNTDDFKHLARKLTHFVMAKELKHCKNVEDLECNDNVKHKAKDFVHKYMGKFGAEYKKEKTLSPRDF